MKLFISARVILLLVLHGCNVCCTTASDMSSCTGIVVSASFLSPPRSEGASSSNVEFGHLIGQPLIFGEVELRHLCLVGGQELWHVAPLEINFFNGLMRFGRQSRATFLSAVMTASRTKEPATLTRLWHWKFTRKKRSKRLMLAATFLVAAVLDELAQGCRRYRLARLKQLDNGRQSCSNGMAPRKLLKK